jgi:transposase
MEVKTLLNFVEKYKGFVYQDVGWSERKGSPCIVVSIRARKNSKGKCAGCGKRASGYDTLPQRFFTFVPLWGIAVYFKYAKRRVDCRDCGLGAEQVPWANGKGPICNSYGWVLAKWAKRLSWKETAKAFQTGWQTVFNSVEMAVEWGQKHIDLSGVTAIGVDEIQWQRGHKYLTLVYQIGGCSRRLLWVGEERKIKTLLRFFRWFGKERAQQLEFICSDLWRAYLRVIAKKAPHAVHVLDRFHVVQRINKAIDEVRAAEAKKLKEDGYEPVLKGARWCLLKRPKNLTDKQSVKLRDVLRYNLKAVRAYLLREEFDQLWGYTSPTWAGKFLDQWCTRVMRSKIEPMKTVARSLRKHRPLILNWFRAKGQISNGMVEGFNNKAKLTTRTAYGFRTFKCAEIALLHALGDLPEPDFTHKFF